MNIRNIFSRKKKPITEKLYTQREVESIIKDVWFRGNRHLLEENNDGKHSFYNVYKDYGFIKPKP
jgi:hypothetical protein